LIDAVVAVVKVSMTKSDSREDILHEDTNLASAFIKTLFGVLYEVYSSAVSECLSITCEILMIRTEMLPELLLMLLIG